MRSDLATWIEVKSGKLDPKKAIATLEKLGAQSTQTYRRVKRFAKNAEHSKKA